MDDFAIPDFLRRNQKDQTMTQTADKEYDADAPLDTLTLEDCLSRIDQMKERQTSIMTQAKGQIAALAKAVSAHKRHAQKIIGRR